MNLGLLTGAESICSGTSATKRITEANQDDLKIANQRFKLMNRDAARKRCATTKVSAEHPVSAGCAVLLLRVNQPRDRNLGEPAAGELSAASVS